MKNIAQLISLTLCGVCLLSCAKHNNINGQNFLNNSPTISNIQNALINHQTTCHQIIASYLDRIYKYNLSIQNHQAPINAISQINPDVMEKADQFDKLYAKTNVLPGSLACVPVIVKDNVDVLGMETNSGSYALLGTKPLSNSEIVNRFEKEGAIIIAKSGMDELAMGVSGISSLDGRIGNAYNTSENPGGSSGGSAASISSNFAVIGIGTDNSGSVRIPAAFNGIYGIRPTQGLISKNGVFPMGNLDGTPGPMARTVTDLAIALNVIANNDHKTNYTAYLKQDALSGKTIAVLHTAGSYDVWKDMPEGIKKTYDIAINNLIKSGARIKQLDLPEFDNNRKNNIAGTVEDVNNYLKNNLATVEDMRQLCKTDRTRVIGNQAECLKIINKIALKNSNGYKEVINTINKNFLYVTKVMHEEHIDGILIPISRVGGSTYDAYKINTWQASVSSNSGLPSVVIQIGHTKNVMPVALEIVGNKFAEGDLLSMAYSYEQNYLSYSPPRLNISNEFDNWSIARLNNLYHQIGKDSYLEFIKLKDKNEITPAQSYIATVNAINEVNKL